MSGSRIVDYVYAHWHNLPKKPSLTEKELATANVMLEMANTVDEGDVDVVTEQYHSQFDDNDQDTTWTPEDEEFHQMSVYGDMVKEPGKANMVQFSRGDLVEITQVEEAVKYYGSKTGNNKNGSRMRPSLATMKSKYRFIKDINHLDKLREYEKNGCVKANRKNNLEKLSVLLEQEVRKAIEEGKILHDTSIRFLIQDIIRKENLELKDFKASHNWLAGWKRRFGLSSRKITKFVAIVRHKKRDQIEKDSKEFVLNTNQLFPLYGLSNIWNADQSGFQLEMHSARTLTFTGSKDVPCVVQNVTSTTHSNTVLPIISADGKLYAKLFIVLKEKNGRFPAKGHFNAPNLIVTCHTSHIMTKSLMKSFFESAVFDSSMPTDILFIVDSWNCWNDQDAIDSVTPATNKIKVQIIPPGCTGRIQPCDVGIFGAFKKVVKHITGHAQLTRSDYKVFQRDETLKLMSLIWWQFCSPKLEDWVKYAWHAAGYDVPRPPPFQTPAQLMFPKDVARDCAVSNCLTTSFIRCVYCEKYFCFHHFVEDFHQC